MSAIHGPGFGAEGPSVAGAVTGRIVGNGNRARQAAYYSQQTADPGKQVCRNMHVADDLTRKGPSCPNSKVPRAVMCRHLGRPGRGFARVDATLRCGSQPETQASSSEASARPPVAMCRHPGRPGRGSAQVGATLPCPQRRRGADGPPAGLDCPRRRRNHDPARQGVPLTCH
jgi:hypothetical protein